ncbi:hypothetical protein J3R30DRAFT_3711845 [Lentinula aciculospora]|uniref:Uncharacterized protein n=1 Tax=Lentinula aciculospora TaxID=153920 RepID=A0A9W8ZZ66_9AGAR|nr:hypothetical protein J3R30DRAFT_3711845 [Lentinula aciculospora]
MPPLDNALSPSNNDVGIVDVEAICRNTSAMAEFGEDPVARVRGDSSYTANPTTVPGASTD